MYIYIYITGALQIVGAQNLTTFDLDCDGTVDAVDTTGDGVADAWDTTGDGHMDSYSPHSLPITLSRPQHVDGPPTRMRGDNARLNNTR